MSDKISYKTTGTCCNLMNVEIENDIIKDVEFIGGCNGNLQGIRNLIKGLNIEEVKGKLKGTSCNGKPTSCPDQLAMCLLEYKQKKLAQAK